MLNDELLQHIGVHLRKTRSLEVVAINDAVHAHHELINRDLSTSIPVEHDV